MKDLKKRLPGSNRYIFILITKLHSVSTGWQICGGGKTISVEFQRLHLC